MSNSVIIQGTTPTIIYTFNSVNTSNITKAYLTFKKSDSSTVALTKDIAGATVETGKISWELTQEETLALYAAGRLEMMINWLTNTGVRGASNKTIVFIDPNHIPEVI